MPAYYRTRPDRRVAAVQAAARALVRRHGTRALAVAEGYADAARSRGDFAALHYWRRTARRIAALRPDAPAARSGGMS